MMGIGMSFGGIGLIVMLLFWGVLIVGGVWLVKIVFAGNSRNHSGNEIQRQSSAREIVDQRYARGEISREEHEQIKADLA